MKIGIISRSPRCYSTQRLKEAAAARGHAVRVLDTFKFAIYVEQELPSLQYRGKSLEAVDAVVPRIGASVTFFGAAVVRQFEQMGIHTLNSSHAISTARDKLRSLQILSRHDIGIPPSAYVRDKDDILPAIQSVGGTPVIIKLLEGTQGVGVMLAQTAQTAQAIIETLQGARHNVMIQKFVAESKGRDIRALVVGDRVVAAMRRKAVGGEFRSNVHRGGRTEAVQLERAYEKTAVKAAQILGLSVAGVDILESSDGPKVMEVNSSPGLEGIEAATGVDVAEAIIREVEAHAMFPELDLRQRLTVRGGYGVAELAVARGSDLANLTIGDSPLAELGVQVLYIDRNNVLIPNPPAGRLMLEGDKLLCFGKLVTLRTLAAGAANGRRATPAGAGSHRLVPRRAVRSRHG